LGIKKAPGRVLVGYDIFGYRKGPPKRQPFVKISALAGVAFSCVPFDPMGVRLLRNPPPQSTLPAQGRGVAVKHPLIQPDSLAGVPVPASLL